MWAIVKIDVRVKFMLMMQLDIFTTGINSATKDAKHVNSLSQKISFKRLDVNVVVTSSVLDVGLLIREKERNLSLIILISHVLFVDLNSRNFIIFISPQIIK